MAGTENQLLLISLTLILQNFIADTDRVVGMEGDVTCCFKEQVEVECSEDFDPRGECQGSGKEFYFYEGSEPPRDRKEGETEWPTGLLVFI